MSWDDFRTAPPSTKVKEPLVRSTNHPHYYAIFRIGKKYKQMDGKQNSGLNLIQNFQKHMEREINVTNADAKIENEILIGDKNIYANVQEYIKDVKLRKNSVIARELLMTASPDFFKSLTPAELEIWKNNNVQWLKDNFGSNCLYSTLHKDESTWHIHSLIVPKFYDEKKKAYILSNTRYFDGIERMRGWQDNYAKGMQEHFKCLNRGIRYSKMKHIELKHYYALLKQNYNDKNLAQTIAKAKNSELLEIKIKAIQKTLEVYKNYNSKNDLEKQAAIQESKKLINEIEKIKDDKESYKKALSLISQSYKIPMYVVENALKMCENISEKENEK